MEYNSVRLKRLLRKHFPILLLLGAILLFFTTPLRNLRLARDSVPMVAKIRYLGCSFIYLHLRIGNNLRFADNNSYIDWRRGFWFGMGKPLVYIRRHTGGSRSILSDSVSPIEIGQQQNSVNINC
ncbi:hypothetical protein CAL7102_00355 [Dulcicalothrix desertica PCC 7102]|nr:hypothetical protein CAL7102_00355 [Dulcicalothrix desertica PCC 7102]